MAGKMGNERVTVKKVEVVRVDKDSNQLWVKGPVPGPSKNWVILEK